MGDQAIFFSSFSSMRPPPPSPSGESSNEFHCRRRLSILAPFIAAVLIFLPANIPGDARSAVTWFHFVRRFCFVASCWVPLSLGSPSFLARVPPPLPRCCFYVRGGRGFLGTPKKEGDDGCHRLLSAAAASFLLRPPRESPFLPSSPF